MSLAVLLWSIAYTLEEGQTPALLLAYFDKPGLQTLISPTIKNDNDISHQIIKTDLEIPMKNEELLFMMTLILFGLMALRKKHPKKKAPRN